MQEHPKDETTQMAAAHDTAVARDWASGPVGFGAVWGIPMVGLVLGGVFDLHAYLWPPALAYMGGACLLNAMRCGRLHCYFTGPFFLATALAALAHGTGLVSLGDDGWRWIGGVVLVGGLGLTYLPEWVWGRYALRT